MEGAKTSAATIRREELRKTDTGAVRSRGPARMPKAGFRPRARYHFCCCSSRSKRLSGRQDPSPVYLALLARHVDSGIVEKMNEAELAYESGYTGQRAIRTLARAHAAPGEATQNKNTAQRKPEIPLYFACAPQLSDREKLIKTGGRH